MFCSLKLNVDILLKSSEWDFLAHVVNKLCDGHGTAVRHRTLEPVLRSLVLNFPDKPEQQNHFGGRSAGTFI